MRSYETLPKGYREIASIDLQQDKKLFWIVNISATVISVVMILAAVLFTGLEGLLQLFGPESSISRLLTLLVLMLVYLVLHEAVHGVLMRHYCKAKVRFGITGPFAYAASDGYFCKKHFAVIGLAPIVIWGVVLLAANILVDESWFYVVWLVQIMNVSGAAGDLYVSRWLKTLPADTLVHDTGVAMTAYSKAE